MMKMVFIQGKNISIVVLMAFIFVTCSVAKHRAVDDDILTMMIDDYLIDYNHYYVNEKLEALTVYVEEKSNNGLSIVIFDVPLGELLNDIRNEKDACDTISIGLYKNIPIEFVSTKLKRSISLAGFLHNSSSLKKKCELLTQYTNGSKFYFLAMDYESYLENTYILKKRIKLSQLIDGTHIKTKFKF